MALKPGEPVQVFFTGQDQRPADHQGPIGRIKSLDNAVSTRFDRGQPDRYAMEPRKGFTGLPQTLRDSSGTDITPTPASNAWTSSELLQDCNGDLLAVDATQPRVWNGYDYWVGYSDDKIVTNKLREDLLVGGYGTIEFADSDILGHVQAVCFTRVTGDTRELMLGFREQPGAGPAPVADRDVPLAGAWTVSPFVVAHVSGGSLLGHIRNDGTRFILVYSQDQLDISDFIVNAYDTHGLLLATNSFGKLEQNVAPGHWDVTVDLSNTTRIIHVQPANLTSVPSSDVNVRFTRISYSAGSITLTGHTETTVTCNGWCQWLVNRFDTSLCYLATTGPGEDNQHVRVYSINPGTLTSVSFWEVAGSIGETIDTITGYVVDNSGIDIWVAVGQLEPQSAVGPKYDPQQRRIQVFQAGTVGPALRRTSISQAITTRPVSLGSDWLLGTYYQSGSGLDATQTVIAPTIAGSGDYFTGSDTQSVTVMPGDYTTGASYVSTNSSVSLTTGMGSAASVLGTDTVANATSTNSGDTAGIPAGTPLLAWTFANNPGMITSTVRGSDLAVLGTSGVTGANGHWTVMSAAAGAGAVIYTRAVNDAGGSLTPGTFAHAGSFQVEALAMYTDQGVVGQPDSITTKFGTALASTIFVGGHLTATGFAGGTNDCTNSLIARVTGPENAPYNALGFQFMGVWVNPTSQSSSAGGVGQRTLVPLHPNNWYLDGGHDFSAVGTGSTLVVSNDVNSGNNGSFGITAFNTSPNTVETGGQPGTVTEMFVSGHLPTIQIQLGTGTLPYTFFIAALATDLASNPFQFIGATLLFTSSNPAASGTYRITGYGPALDGTIFCERVTNADDIPAQALVNGVDSVVIYLSQAVTAPFQPTYFLIPFQGKRSTVGVMDRLSAWNNWRMGGQNLMFGHLTQVCSFSDGLAMVLPTAQESINTVNDQDQISQGSTVGLKLWTLRSEYGNGIDTLLPGAMAVSYEKDAFPEDGFTLAPEAPWLVSTATASSGQLALEKGGTYVYSITVESQDSQGNRVFSPPSPPLTVGLTGTHNQITIGGDLPVPWDTVAAPIDGFAGVTNRDPVTLCISRTSYRNGQPTTTQYKITPDAKPNAVAPWSANNPSGFSFTGDSLHVQWTFVDQWDDLTIQNNEQLYSQSALPRFGGPAFSDACFWADRYWAIAADGSIWFSTAVTDGQRPSWFPGFAVQPPAGDRPVCVRPLQQFLIVLCESGIYYLPQTALPSSSLADLGQIGIPSLVKLPFTQGCTGQALTTAAGVAYASTAGGVWLVTRGLSLNYLSEPAVALFEAMDAANHKVQGMAMDRLQRMVVSTGAAPIVFDTVSGLWSEWTLPGDVGMLTAFDGSATARMGSFVMAQGNATEDTTPLQTYSIDWSAELAGISFGSVRAFARLWRLQLIGEYRGPHNLAVTISYPDDFPADPTVCPVIQPSSTEPYLYEAIPGHGKAGQFVVTISVNHDGQIDPGGDSCSIELLSAKVGVQAGQKQLPDSRRI